MFVGLSRCPGRKNTDAARVGKIDELFEAGFICRAPFSYAFPTLIERLQESVNLTFWRKSSEFRRRGEPEI
jgi:hypothetical protein